MKCLIIEDDDTVRHFIEKGLENFGHVCASAADGDKGLFLATTEHFDVIILDRMLPNIDGLAVLETLRANNTHTPVLILSAQNKVDDKVTGLRSGADDYLTKPFAFEELLARLEILVERAGHKSAADIDVLLTAADLSLNLLTRQVTRSTKTIDLQGREFKLLEYMMRNKGRVITRTMLLEQVWDYNFDPQTNIIDVHISRLRQKIDKGFDYPLIETVRGAGYRLIDAPREPLQQ